jgi:aromatic-L-amino-acid/L-tryptophan decarboxylase
MEIDEFRRLGHQLIEDIAAYRQRLAREPESLPVMSQVAPGDIRARFPTSPPSTGGGLAAALPALERDLLPGITHWNHPSFFGYFPSNTSLASILGDLLCAGLGAQGMSWQTSPAATELEEVVVDWLRQMLGLSTAFSGVIHDTASTATLCALLCARERTSGFAQQREGLQSAAAPLVVYASDQAHSSVEKAALLAGFGKAHLRAIATDDDHGMRVDLLEAAILDDLAAGRRPCAVVAATGTTATTALDPVAAIAELAQRHGLWLHLDAALAGNAMILPECRWMWQGVEAADSIVINPHKWMGVGFDFTLYLVRDPQHLVRVMATNPSYLHTAQDQVAKNLRDWGIPLGRRFRALKAWMVIVDQGVDGISARLRRDLANARWLAEQIDATPGWERVAPVPLQTVCVRHLPPGVAADDEEAIARHNLGIADRINRSGRAYLTPSKLKGRQMLRLSIGAEPTERAHVKALWQLLREAAAE